jgi:hypothetical protein
VADEHCAAVVGEGQLFEMRERSFEVFCGRGPLAARHAEAAVLDVPAGDPGVAERFAEVAGVDQVVGRLPVAAVQDERERERALAWRDAEIAELERLRP